MNFMPQCQNCGYKNIEGVNLNGVSLFIAFNSTSNKFQFTCLSCFEISKNPADEKVTAFLFSQIEKCDIKIIVEDSAESLSSALDNMDAVWNELLPQ